MKYTLIIAEKPAAAKKIADALANGKPIKKNDGGIPYYEITRGKNDIVVAAAVGHLYGLKEKDKHGWTYPIFDIAWYPASDISKSSAFTKKYLSLIKKLAKNANNFYLATDKDVEGELLGHNILKNACKQKDAKRMEFSTLTPEDLIHAYENAKPHLDFPLAEAGETRHFLDFYYGINISRALTSAIKKSGQFKILSTGRVQGPALKIITDKEQEIQAFKPEKYWQIELQGIIQKQTLSAWHEKDQFWNKQEADIIVKKITGEKEAIVIDIQQRTFAQKTPTPFDLTTLQTEAYRCFGIKPKHALDIAQELYTSGYISYPRTSSQQLPKAIGYTKLINALAKQAAYKQLATTLLNKKNLVPNEGKKSDPAHPAIYPTGVPPQELEARENKIYDLIVKRFLAVFAEDAQRETNTIVLEVKQEKFLAKGTRTTFPGWHTFYAPYVKLEEQELPKVTIGDKLTIKKIIQHDKETQPPKRYTPASIIKELEKRNLGTKATRADIVDRLYQRNYIKKESIIATDLGIHLTKILEQHCPKIVDEELTRHFEEEMDDILNNKIHEQEILDKAKKIIIDISEDFKKKEQAIGDGLKQTFQDTRQALETIGDCPKCKDGSLVIKRGKYGRFIACDKYPECKATFKLPPGKFDPMTTTCEHCTYPEIKIFKKGKRPQTLCINPDCPTKKVDVDENEKKTCPKCGKPLALRKSVYGAFYGCTGYPKCKHIEKIETILQTQQSSSPPQKQ